MKILSGSGSGSIGVRLDGGNWTSFSYNATSAEELLDFTSLGSAQTVEWRLQGGMTAIQAWMADDLVFSQRQAAPVPEPATMLLMATGLAGLIGARRKKIVSHEAGAIVVPAFSI